MNGKEIVKAIEEKMRELSINPMGIAEGDDVSDADWEELKTFCGGYSCVRMGREDEYYMYTLHFPQHDVYIEFAGDYNSWSGTDWDGARPYEVRPVQKTITVYEVVR